MRINNNLLIILPFYNKPNWTADYQEQTTCQLSKKYQVVAYCEYNKVTIKDIVLLRKSLPKPLQKIDGKYYFTPFDILPFVRFTIIKKINSLINMSLLFLILRINPFRQQLIIWGFHPEVADFAKHFPLKHTSVYDCVDYFDSLIAEHKAIIKKQEDHILKHFDYVVVNSHSLYSLHSKKRSNIHIAPLGFSQRDQIIKVKKITQNRSIIGFVGAINYRLDYILLKKLIERNKKWTFVFWGPRQKDAQDMCVSVDENIDYIFSLQNVIHGQSDRRDEVYSMIQQFDICIIPYDTSLAFNKYCYPMKLFEYFFIGKPVVSTPINELEYYPKYIRIGKTAKVWEQHIRRLLEQPWPKIYKSEQREIAFNNTWEKKIESIRKILKEFKKYD